MIAEWRAILRHEFAAYGMATLRRDFLAALTVAAVALPLALAFGVASGATAAAGLITAVIGGIVIGALGGAPYQVSGPTGAMSAVLIVLASRHGLGGVWLAGLLAGVMLIALGFLRLGRVVALIPSPVVTGFTSGIAVLVAFGQIDSFLGVTAPPSENTLVKLGAYLAHPPTANLQAVAIGLLVVATMLIWPRIQHGRGLPGSLLAIAVATGVAALAGWDVPVIGAIPNNIVPADRLTLTAIPWGDFGALVVPAMSIAALGAIESLLCGAVAGNMTGIRLNGNVELVAQGIGNVVIPFLGGVPATAAIARTSVNIRSGGVTRMAPILHGVTLLGAGVALAGVIGRVPLAALAGVLFVTSWRMNEWHAIRLYFRHGLRHAIAGFLITLAATVLLDLTQAIVIGFGISTLIFMAQMSELHITRRPVEAHRLPNNHSVVDPTVVVYYLSGPLFFGAARRLIDFVEGHDEPSKVIVLSIRGVPLVDATGVDVLRALLQRQRSGGGDIYLTSMDERVELLLSRAGFLTALGADRVFWSADKALAALGAASDSGGSAEQPAVDEDLESAIIAPFAEKMEPGARE